MKKLIYLLAIFCSVALSQTNNINKTVPFAVYSTDTLTTSIDTADVFFANSDKYSYQTLFIATLSGADTVTVWEQSLDTLSYSQVSLVDKSSGSSVTSIPVSTTPKEYIVFDGWKQKIRLISSSNDGSSTRFILGIK